MKADDPRHGEYRGHLQHRKDGEDPCEPCIRAAFRRNKAMKLRLESGIRHRVPIGDEAWRILTTSARKPLALATGLPAATLAKIRSRGNGPETIVHINTRTALLMARGPGYTPVGLARRLQAITAMGWSMRVVADGTPFSMDAYKRVRRESGRVFVQYELGLEIVAAYNRLSMIPAPSGRSAAKTRRWAADKGYLSGLAWEDDTIDDPEATPVGLTGRYIVGDYIDEAAVIRRMAGERLTLTKAERIEVVSRLRAAQWTFSRIEEHTGLKTDRYIAREKAAA